ncbi:MAG TPA: tetratricopeptide repeat protein [Phycisphaerales bacterium]|nr:tetratricopeptide repeat protein [Phycisphaerales bacterium]
MSDWMDAEQHADRALEMYERGRWAEAEAELRKAIAMNPDQAEWHFNLGLTLEAAGRESDALLCFSKAAELMPDELDPLMASGSLCSRLGRFEQAIEFFDRVIKLDPSMETAYANKIECHTRLNQHQEAETAFYLAQQALEEPGGHCLAAIGESLFLRRNFERAEWCFREALRLEPNLPRVRSRLASVFASTNRQQRAAQLYLQELRDEPGNIDTLLEYADLLRELGRLPEAGEKLRRVLELEPANAYAHFQLGQIAYRTAKYEQAQIEFGLVLKLDPKFPQIRTSAADTLLKLEQREEAKAILAEELDLFRCQMQGEAPASADVPEFDVPSMMRLGSLLLQVGDSKAAEEVFNRAAERADAQNAIVTQRAEIYRQLALARFRSGDRAGGARASRRVLRLEPACIASFHNLALAALQEDRLRVAAGWLARGLRVAPHDDGLRRLRMRLWLAAVRRMFARIGIHAAS